MLTTMHVFRGSSNFTQTATLSMHIPFVGAASLGFAWNQNEFGVVAKLPYSDAIPKIERITNSISQIINGSDIYSENHLAAADELTKGNTGRYLVGLSADFGFQQGGIKDLRGISKEINVAFAPIALGGSVSPDGNFGGSISGGSVWGGSIGTSWTGSLVIFNSGDMDSLSRALNGAAQYIKDSILGSTSSATLSNGTGPQGQENGYTKGAYIYVGDTLVHYSPPSPIDDFTTAPFPGEGGGGYTPVPAPYDGGSGTGSGWANEGPFQGGGGEGYSPNAGRDAIDTSYNFYDERCSLVSGSGLYSGFLGDYGYSPFNGNTPGPNSVPTLGGRSFSNQGLGDGYNASGSDNGDGDGGGPVSYSGNLQFFSDFTEDGSFYGGSTGGQGGGGSTPQLDPVLVSAATAAFGGTPIILDLTGAGINITPLSSSNMFMDMANDGHQQRTAWAGAGNGVLVYAPGGGPITQANQYQFTLWDPTARTDMEALASVFDANHDGALNASDSTWNNFRILVTNADGTTSLQTMVQAGVASIDLQANAFRQSFSDGSTIDGETSFTRTDGSFGTAATVTLAAEFGSRTAKQTVVHNADGSTTIQNSAYALSGSLAEKITTTTSADGRSRTIVFDWNGDGVVDQKQTYTSVVNANAITVETLRNEDASGTLLNKTTTTTSADRKTVTIARDLSGDGLTDQLEVDTTYASGDTSVTVSNFTRNGSLINRTASLVSDNGLSRTLAIDSTGNGYDDLIQTDVTVVAADGSRTETITDSNSDGSMRGRTVTVTSADRLTITRSSDAAGNGIFNLKATDTTVVAANGSRTTTHLDKAANNAVLGRTKTTISADGRTTTTRIDHAGNNTYDLVQTDAISFDASGKRTEVTTLAAADGSTYAKRVIQNIDGRTGSTQTYKDSGYGLKLSQDESKIVNAASELVDTTTSYSSNGSIVGRTVSTTTDDGLVSTTKVEAFGSGVYATKTRTETVINGTGSVTTQTSSVSKDAEPEVTVGKIVTTTNADGSTVTQLDNTGSGTFDATVSYKKTSNPDGTVGEVTSTTSANLTLLGRTVVVTSADRSSVKTTTINGDGETIRIATKVTGDSGVVTLTTADYAPNGTLIGRTVQTTTANGLTKTTQIDVLGTGTGFSSTNTDVTVINSNGSRSQTVTNKSGNGTVIDSTITTTSANGLTSVQTTNVDGKVDYTTTDAKTFNSDGSVTQRVTVANANGAKIRATATTISGNGLSVTNSSDVDGDGTVDVTQTDVTVINANGSHTETITSVNGVSGSLRSKTVKTTSASGASYELYRDGAGRGFNDQVETVVTLANGDIVDTVSTKGSLGQVLGQTVTTTGASGLWKTTATDFDGNGTADQTQSVSTAYGVDGSRAVSTTFKAGTSTIASSVQTTSADGRTVTTVGYDGGNNSLGSTTDVTVINADGSKGETSSQYSKTGVLLGRTITTVSSDQKTTTIQKRTDNTAQDASKSTSVVHADGSVVATVSSYSPNGGLISKVVKTTTANGLSTSLIVDSNGDGVTDDTQSNVTVLNADGSVVETFNEALTSNAWSTKVVTTTSANGLTKSVATTGTIKSISDNNTLTDVTVINNDGSKTETRTIVGTNWNGASTAWSKQTIQSSANGLSTTSALSALGDSVVDSAHQVTTAADGEITTTTTLRNRDGSAWQTDVLTTSATGLSSSLQSKRNGSTGYNHFQTRTTNGDGSLTDTIWDTNAAGATVYKLVSNASANGLVKTVQIVPTDGSAVGSVTKDITTIGSDGVSTDTDSVFNGAGQLRSKTVRTTSADGMTVTTTADINGDGAVDETTNNITVVKADGSRTETTTTSYASGTQKSQTVVSTSANGLAVTTDTTVNGYTKTNSVKTIDSSGATTETVKRYRADGTTLAASTVTTTSADGRTTIVTQKDASGTVTKTETTIVQANAFGSYNWLVQNGSGVTQQEATHLVDANGVDRVSLTIGSSTYRATLTKEQADDFRAKVGRTYATVVGRAASQTDVELALQYYSTSGLDLKALTIATLASSEFNQKYGTLTDVQFIEQIYRNALDRGASLAELSSWLGQSGQTTTRDAFTVAVSEGAEHLAKGNVYQETNNTFSPDSTWSQSRAIDAAKANIIVGGLYKATLGRVADVGGLATYSATLLNGTKTEAQIIAALMATSEFTSNFGALPNQVFVARAFVDGLSRPPSEAEAQFWTAKLVAGTASKADLILAIANTPDAGNVIDNHDGTEQRLVYSVNPSDVWQSQNQLWKQATSTTASATVSSKDWVTTTTQVWVTEGHEETDESGTHWVDTSHNVTQTTTAQQTRSHSHSVVTQKDSSELSVTTVGSNGTSTTTTVSNSLGDEAWTQILLTYEGGNLLDTITTNDNGTRSIAINRAAGSDVIAGTSTDVFRFATGISYNQLWFNKSDSNLLITIIGQDETMTLTGWYASAANRPATIISGDGYSLTYAGIDSLVQSMAGQVIPTSGTNGVTLVAAPTPVLAQDTSTDKRISSNGQVNISGLVAGAAWQYSLDGGITWIAGSSTSIAETTFGADGAKTVQVRQADSRGNFSPAGALSFTLDNVEAAPTLALATDTSGNKKITSNGLVNVFDLGLGGTWQYSLNGTTWFAGSGTTIAAASLGADGAKTVRVRQTDIAGNVSATSSLTFTLDTSAPVPSVNLVQDTSSGSKITSNGQVSIGGVVSQAVWEYSMDGGQSWAVGTGTSIASASFGADGSKTVKVRQTDVAGNVSSVASLTFVLATVAAAPILELLQDTSHGQGFSSNGQINISQLASGGTWQYSLNGGTSWETGVGTSIATAALGGNGAKTVKVRQTDAAGNTSAEVSLNFTLDTSAISPSVGLTQDTSNGKLTTYNGQVKISGLVNGASWTYSLDGGQSWIAGTGTTIAEAAFGLDGYKTVQVRQTDAAGKTSPSASFTFTLANGTPIYAFGEAIGETFDNGDGNERRVEFNTSRTGGWAYKDHLWQKATTTTANASVTSKDWVTTTTQVWVTEGHEETDESGTYWVDTSHNVPQTTIAQQTQSHGHSLVTQKDAVELSVTTASTNGTLTTATVATSAGEQPWSQIITTYEAGILLDKITIGDNGKRIIEVSRAAGGDVITGVATDTVIFGAGISYNQLWFTKFGSDLAITVIGQNETLTLNGWYASAPNHVGSIQSGDGYTISDAGVLAMVQAMASLTPPLSGQTALPTALASQLAIPLATNWQHA